jgi:DEAD/DEAH box helicase domain-containing protein
LYYHQEQAIRLEANSAADEKPALVITAGTGAGKTEAFLLPLLNGLFRQPRGADEVGVRAIVLYPMNALVNDQVERVYEWLKGQKQVTLFHFTGETPEDEQEAQRGNYPPFEACRMRTRELARRNVPDILITNYSMLEYMLCRPQDAVFFGSALQTFVVDEAHIYNGTLAAEIALLMRRVLLRCSVDAQQIFQIATSATLGGEVPQFIAKLFGKTVDQVKWIQGESVRCVLPASRPPDIDCVPSSVRLDALEDAVFVEDNLLVEDNEVATLARRAIEPLVHESVIGQTKGSNIPAQILHSALRYSPVIARLEEALWQGRNMGLLRLRDLAEKTWGRQDEEATHATARLLQLGARARQSVNDLPLIPHKLHLMARAPATVSVCMNPACTATTEPRLQGAGRMVAEAVDKCPSCGKATLTYVGAHDVVKPCLQQFVVKITPSISGPDGAIMTPMMSGIGSRHSRTAMQRHLI